MYKTLHTLYALVYRLEILALRISSTVDMLYATQPYGESKKYELTIKRTQSVLVCSAP